MRPIKTKRSSIIRVLLAFTFCLPALAFAHHPLDGMMPKNFTDGLLSGIGHPIIGLDHLAFVIAAGVLAWKLGKPIALLAGFIVATAVGSLVVSSGISFSFKEPLILVSVAVIGFLLIRQQNFGGQIAMFFYPIAGFLHGAAYGEAVVGAEATPVVAYLIGFTIVQFAIGIAASRIIKFLSNNPEQTSQYVRVTGAVVFGIAVTYGFEMAETAIF